MSRENKIAEKLRKFVDPYRIEDGKKFRLKDFDPSDTGKLESVDKPEAQEMLTRGINWLALEQDKLYAQNRWSVLLVFQAMDAAGKDGTIKHVMSGINPQGCQVTSFKQPSHEELDHDFMWRSLRALPERGRIGIFNRSYYEEVLVVRVHQELLKKQQLPPELVTKDIWEERLHDIASFERYLARNGTLILKFFLNVSKKEQKKRFTERLERPEKNWKFSASDVKERAHWKEYMEAYDEAIGATATKHAPWFVVPADTKWYTRLVVAAAIVESLHRLDIAYPEVTSEQRRALAEAREALLKE
jgi:PPK2 family polyphosphate:nucleotide phosphotransferase